MRQNNEAGQTLPADAVNKALAEEKIDQRFISSRSARSQSSSADPPVYPRAS
jgi:hypothetical protein